MTLKSDATFPSRRTYVVKLRSDAAPDALSGRLENLVTGGQRDFASGDELLASMAGDLQSNGAAPAGPQLSLGSEYASEEDRS